MEKNYFIPESNVLQRIEAEFFKELDAKNSWGKNEAKSLYYKVSTTAMSDEIVRLHNKVTEANTEHWKKSQDLLIETVKKSIIKELLQQGVPISAEQKKDLMEKIINIPFLVKLERLGVSHIPQAKVEITHEGDTVYGVVKVDPPAECKHNDRDCTFPNCDCIDPASVF